MARRRPSALRTAARGWRPKRRERYDLTLYVMDMTPRSRNAIANTEALCEELLHGRYTLQVVDITNKPELARNADIFAAPTRFKRSPLPECRLVGDMSDRVGMRHGLGL